MSSNFDVTGLKKQIHTLVRQTDIEDRIREQLQKFKEKPNQLQKENVASEIINTLKDEGVLKQIIDNIHDTETSTEPGNKTVLRQSNDKNTGTIPKTHTKPEFASTYNTHNSETSQRNAHNKEEESSKFTAQLPMTNGQDGNNIQTSTKPHVQNRMSRRMVMQKDSKAKYNNQERKYDKRFIPFQNKELPVKLDDECALSSLFLPDSEVFLKESHDKLNDNMHIKINPRKRHLHFEIINGKAFLDHLLEESQSMFVLFLHFRGHRFWTQPSPCNSEPDFNAGFIFELHSDALRSDKIADASHLLGITDKLHLVLVKVLASGDKQLVSSYFFEWRQILTAEESKKTYLIELQGVGAESNITIGTIEVCLTLIPKLSEPLPHKVLSSQISLEKNRLAERERIFLVYAKTWWKEYLAVRPEHSQRMVKIFQQDENSHIRPVFQYVHVLEVGRPLLEVPREAVWFVSLMVLETPALAGALPAVDQWWNPHTFLSIKKGGPENHAALLCSLLLGFGLDAYVCIGTKDGNLPWAWVMTVGNNDYVTFWESTTGSRYIHTKISSSEQYTYPYPFKTIGCIFNHKRFYANIQETDKVKLCSFNLENRCLWKNMSEAAIATVTKNTDISLMPGWTDPFVHSQDMESQLRVLVTEYRKDINLPTRWDIQLCHLIAPILTIYEIEHKMGVAVGTEEFNELMSKNIPEGFAFKALPVRVAAMKSRRILGFCLRNTALKEIITCQEVDTKLALRVHTYVYPENVLSMWLIIACKYRTK